MIVVVVVFVGMRGWTRDMTHRHGIRVPSALVDRGIHGATSVGTTTAVTVKQGWGDVVWCGE